MQIKFTNWSDWQPGMSGCHGYNARRFYIVLVQMNHRLASEKSCHFRVNCIKERSMCQVWVTHYLAFFVIKGKEGKTQGREGVRWQLRNVCSAFAMVSTDCHAWNAWARTKRPKILPTKTIPTLLPWNLNTALRTLYSSETLTIHCQVLKERYPNVY